MTSEAAHRSFVSGYCLASLALTVVMGCIAFAQLASIDQRATDIVTDSVPGMYYSTEIRGRWILNDSLMAQFIGQYDKSAMAKVEPRLQANLKRLEESISKYETTMTAGVAKDRELFETFKKLRTPYAARAGSSTPRTARDPFPRRQESWFRICGSSPPAP